MSGRSAHISGQHRKEVHSPKAGTDPHSNLCTSVWTATEYLSVSSFSQETHEATPPTLVFSPMCQRPVLD